jgi:predicted ATPase/class 3 adenylate cyclase
VDGPNRSLPSGTVTFLYTDIVGSTDIAQQYPDELPALLERHHAILRQAVEAHHGSVFRIAGDSFHVAFHTARDALEASVEAQRLLHEEAWAPAPIKVRMGINTGIAQADNNGDQPGEYTGYSTLARAQRVMSVAYGGQVLVSNASAEQVRVEIPQGVTLRDMGEHQLKGLLNPEHLWQVVAADLPQNFPQLQTIDVVPSNLPISLNPMVGRENELREIEDRLAHARLITLLGPGGIGKTRLALEIASDQRETFDDRVYFVDLTSSREVESVLEAIAQAIGLKEKSDRSLIEDLKLRMRNQSMLLLLDNFEQVTVAAPAMVELLQDCPKLKQLVTSRETLNVGGEVVFPVPPLGLPRSDLKQISSRELEDFEAIQLFVERAQSVKPGFRLSDENAQAIAEICIRLDGLPLAIELVTARLKLFPPQALVERLGNRLELLRGGARDLPARQQALRDTINWSYELLDPGEQHMFMLLSVFSGATFEAIEETAARIPNLNQIGLDVLDSLNSLVDKSLIRQIDQGKDGYRFLMFETIREFAGGELAKNPDLSDSAHRSHATTFADFVQRQWERLKGDERDTAIEEMVADIENIRSAWRYWVAEGDLDQLRKFTNSLWMLYDERGWYHGTVSLTKDMLNVLSSAPPSPEVILEQITLRTSLARALLITNGYTQEVEEAYTNALELCEREGEVPQIFPVLRGLSSFYMLNAEFEKGARIGEQILALAQRYNDERMLVEGHLVLGANLAFLNDLKTGLDHLEKGMAAYNPHQRGSSRYQLGNNPGVVCTMTSAFLLWFLGYPDRASHRANEAIALSERLHHPSSMAYAQFHTGLLHLFNHQAQLAFKCAEAALDIAVEHEFQIWNAVSSCLRGAALSGMGQVQEGLKQIQQAISHYQELKSPPVCWPMLLSLEAGACASAGKPGEGLNLINEALEIAERSSRESMLTDLYLLKGDLLLVLSEDNMTDSEFLFQRAMEISIGMEAPMLELRAALRLGRLWRRQGKAEPARHMLSNVLEKLTEGYSTADLMDAKTLMEELE